MYDFKKDISWTNIPHTKNKTKKNSIDKTFIFLEKINTSFLRYRKCMINTSEAIHIHFEKNQT